MIYCVVPQELADELYDKLSQYYEDDPNVTVIIDRRAQGGEPGSHAAYTDRRRQRDFRSRGHVPPWTGPRSAGRVSVLLVITDSDKSRDKYRASGVQVAEPYPGRATVHRL